MPPETQIDDLEAELPVVLDEAGVLEGTEKPANADPSTATDVSKPEDTLSVVREVVEARKEPSAEVSSATGEEAGTTADDKTPKEPDNESFSDVPFNKHPRFQQLVGELKTARVDAGRYRNIETFLDRNGIAADEAADLLTVGALAKTNPAEAWKRAKPWVQNLLIAAGEVLPEELRTRVASGEMTQAAAVELSRANAQITSHQVRSTFEQQQAEKRAQTDIQTSIHSAAQEWEADRQLKDPNFGAKVGPLQREVAFLHATEGKPKDAAGVKDQLARAYKAVNAAIPPAAPPIPVPREKPALRPVNGGQVAGNAPTGPVTTLDIIRANRRQG